MMPISAFKNSFDYLLAVDCHVFGPRCYGLAYVVYWWPLGHRPGYYIVVIICIIVDN